jgi:hypothetical protein
MSIKVSQPPSPNRLNGNPAIGDFQPEPRSPNRTNGEAALNQPQVAVLPVPWQSGNLASFSSAGAYAIMI